MGKEDSEFPQAVQLGVYEYDNKWFTNWMRWVFISPASSGQITFYCIFAFMAPVLRFSL
jgi:hypothetical protein